jgi:hypothetical protein
MKYYSLYFGQAYGEGNYGSGNYSCTVQQEQAGTCVAAGGTNGNGGGGSLADTGIGIVAIATFACLIIFLALIIRVWKRKPVLQPVVVAADEPSQSERTDDQPTSQQ